MKRVEIIRGPASALYGSDALGGVVSYVTKDPADYLKLVGKDWYMSTKGGFPGVLSTATRQWRRRGKQPFMEQSGCLLLPCRTNR